MQVLIPILPSKTQPLSFLPPSKVSPSKPWVTTSCETFDCLEILLLTSLKPQRGGCSTAYDAPAPTGMEPGQERCRMWPPTPPAPCGARELPASSTASLGLGQPEKRLCQGLQPRELGDLGLVTFIWGGEREIPQISFFFFFFQTFLYLVSEVTRN